MSTLGERIARLALRTFDTVPAKSKPRSHPHGLDQWVPMAAVVLARDASATDELLNCVSLATGCKCLPYSALPRCCGEVLHDSHAEILALRGLNRWLLAEVTLLVQNQPGYESPFLMFIDNDTAGALWPPLSLRPNISIHLFSTEPPCGDASMENLMTELGPEASKPWTESSPHPPQTMNMHDILQPQTATLRGRAHFSLLGQVRRKPSRADAEPSLSKSCTDKLTVKQLTGLLSFPAYYFIANTSNAYLSSLILPHNKHSAEACSRAFSPQGRLAPVKHLTTPEAYMYHPFQVHPLPPDFPAFPFSKPSRKMGIHGTHQSAPKLPKPTNISALYIRNQHSSQTSPVIETLLNGVKQGYPAFSSPPASVKKASTISRSSLLRLGKEIARHLFEEANQESDVLLIGQRNTEGDETNAPSSLQAFIEASTYDEAKRVARQGYGAGRVATKESVIRALPGQWPKNLGDGNWTGSEKDQ